MEAFEETEAADVLTDAHQETGSPAPARRRGFSRTDVEFRWPRRDRVAPFSLLLLLALCAAIAPQVFAAASVREITASAGILMIASLGQLLVVIVGGIDLSVASVMTLAAAISVRQTGLGHSLAAVLLEAVTVCLAIGLVQGIAIAYVELNPVIVTLAMSGVVSGATLLWTGVTFSATGLAPASLIRFAHVTIGSVNVLLIVALVLGLLTSLALRVTVPGRRYVAAGTNPRAAFNLGIDTRRHAMLGYAVAAVCYATAGTLLAAKLSSPNLSLGGPYQFLTLVAVALAGATFAGGPTSVASLLAACLFLPTLDQFLSVRGWPAGVQLALQGLVLIAACAALTLGSRVAKGFSVLRGHAARSLSS